MKYTNKHNLPDAVFAALCRDSYSKGASDYSATEILNPPQLVQLKRRYDSELESDVMDNVWILLGKAAHTVLEQHAPEESLSEERLSVTLLDRILSGQTDNYHNKIITDYKITSAMTLVYGSRIKEWEEQLNIYAYIFRNHGYDVEKLQIVTILRDWSESKAKTDNNYPQTPIQMLYLNLWSEQEQHDFILSRISRQIAMEQVPDEELEPCSPEDMWEQAATFAVMKEGRKKAIRVFPTEDEARAYLEEMEQNGTNGTCYIQARPGQRIRCERYCPVSQYCHQYRRYLNDIRNRTEETDT